MKKRYQSLVVKLDRIADRTARLGWRLGYDPRRGRHCLFTPDHRCYDFQDRPALMVRAHRQVKGELL